MNDGKNELLKPLHYFNIEKYILIIVMFMIILLIGLNTLRVYKGYTVIQRSGSNNIYDSKNILYDKGTITLSIDESNNYPMLEIIVNGDIIDRFDENKEVTIDVAERDVVQINGSMYKDDIAISIKNISPNIPDHLNGTRVLIKQNISTVAIIKM